MKNYSKQREEILEVLKKSYDHPTAEQVYLKVKANKSTSSKGTVYRNLNLLVENGLIIKIPMQDGPDRYDYLRKKHNHIICKNCGKIFDFEYEFDLKQVKDTIKQQTKMESFLDTVIVFGICNDCIKKEN